MVDVFVDTGVRLAVFTPEATVLVCAGADGRLPAGITVPFGRAGRGNDGVLTVGLQPGRWLLLADSTPGGELVQLSQSPEDGFVSVVDVSSAYTFLRLTGSSARSVLEKLCAANLRERVMPDGTALRTLVAGIVTGVVRDDRRDESSYLLVCDRSYGQYLHEILLDAGEEFGIVGDGPSPVAV